MGHINFLVKIVELPWFKNLGLPLSLHEELPTNTLITSFKIKVAQIKRMNRTEIVKKSGYGPC